MLPGLGAKPLDRGGLWQGLRDNAMVRVSNVAELRSLRHPSKPTIFYLECHTTQGDGGEGPVVWVPTSTTADNNGTVFRPNSLPTQGRYLRPVEGSVQSKWFGPDAAGTTDATSAIQNAITAAYRLGVECYINAGTFLTTGVAVFDFSRVVFNPSAKLKMSADGFGIRTLTSPSASLVTGNVRRVQLISPYVDMNSKNGIGILFEGVTTSFMDDPRVENIGAGTFNYNDGVDNMVGLPTMGIALKGVGGVQGAYYNDIVRPRTFGGNVGLWMGTSTTTRSSKANHNTVWKPVCQDATIGIWVHTADDNLVVQPDCSNSGVGLRVGVTGGGVKECNRNRIVNSYMEICTTGLDITSESAGAVLDGIQSIIGTATPIADAGTGTALFYPKRLGDAEKYARFYEQKVKGVTEIEICGSGGTVVGKITEGSGSTRVQIRNVDNAGVEVMTGAASAGTTNAAWRPLSDNTQRLGSASFRWSEVFAGNAAINTSDETLKQDIEAIPQEILDAWGDVQFVRFKWKDAAKMKGNGARWHFGLIAQRVKAAFEARGLDPFALGLLCYDEWAEEVNEAGVVLAPAGNRYGIRYEEALALECAYLRSRINH